MTDVEVRRPRQEAERLAGIARVLEPSPPAVDTGPWYADDPYTADAGDWTSWLRRHPEHAGWAAARWLGAYPRLGGPPPAYASTRLSLHRLAVYVISPARRRANGKIALRWTLGGFGTPFFGADEQVRVVGTTLVRQRGDEVAGEPITTLRRAAELVLAGEPDLAWATGFDVPAAGDLDAVLPVDGASADFLGHFYGFAASVLEELRTQDAAPSDRVQLWPEHFDAAFRDRGATFGASPGDAATPEPYLYVLPEDPDTAPSPAWNATAFRGAILPWSELAGSTDQRDTALSFLRSRADLTARAADHPDPA